MKPPILLRITLNLAAAILVAIAAFLGWKRIQGERTARVPGLQAQGAGQEDQTSSRQRVNKAAVPLPPFSTPASLDGIIVRRADLDTIIPTRPRDEVITYTVQLGDNLFSIGDNFGLKPETILWGNFETLQDNPEILQVDQVLNILPVDGVYYQWSEGDSLESVASFFKVQPEDILGYPGNKIDLTASFTSTAVIEPGSWLIVPGGKRVLKDWGPPAISRSNPAVARYYGPGSCGEVYEGAIGTGAFLWPTTERMISGYNFTAIHPAIDIGGQVGNAVYASDSGVVVYAGWSNYGYGNLLVIDHGNGWQTAYAHLSSIGVGCGQSVTRGIMVAGLGSTGNSTGPHLHFEMSYYGAKVNPFDYAQ
jgi:murein DD-endopeptidase MepM/ murein hydrolase activator NlpD